MIPAILDADRANRPKPVLLGAIGVLVAVQALLGMFGSTVPALAALMLGFFVAFNVLEAMLPSLVSRIAPAQGRGVAIGVYNTTQTLGVFFGGWLGGLLAKHHGSTGVFAACAALSVLWV